MLDPAQGVAIVFLEKLDTYITFIQSRAWFYLDCQNFLIMRDMRAISVLCLVANKERFQVHSPHRIGYVAATVVMLGSLLCAAV